MAEENKDKNIFLSILENGAIIIGALTLIGYLKIYLYYRCYKIDISDFISFEEVITPFIDDLLFFVFFMFMTNTYTFIFRMYIKEEKKKIFTTGNEVKEVRGFKDNLKKLFTSFFGLISLIGIIGMFYSIVLINNFYSNTIVEEIYCNKIIGYLLFSFGLATSFISTHEKDLKRLYEKSKTLIFCLIIFSIILIHNIFDLTKEIKSNSKQYLMVKHGFEFKDFKIETDSTLVLLGRTKSKIFFQNKKESRVDIYNVEEIQKEFVK